MEWLRPLDRPAARRARVAGLTVVGLSLIAAAIFVVLPLVGRTFVRLVELLVAGCVWTATSIGVGVSVWDVLATIGRSVAAGLTTPAASVRSGGVFTVTAPDLVPTALTAPTAVSPRQPITVSWTVTNRGTGSAVPRWNDVVYLSTDRVCCAVDEKITQLA